MAQDVRSQKADALLKSLQQQQGGQLKIFLGAAPGVGKTCAMLNAAKECMQQGVKVTVGLIETHGRADTEAMLQGFNILPRRELNYHGQQLTEFDLDAALAAKPELILVDGNKFHPYNYIPHQCIIKGDSKVLSIAAASILAKNYRDRLMIQLHEEHPEYGWDTNFGYATKKHQEALIKHGPTVHHRQSFRLKYD